MVLKQTWLAFFPGAEPEVVSSAGHCPMPGTPAALATPLGEFLERK